MGMRSNWVLAFSALFLIVLLALSLSCNPSRRNARHPAFTAGTPVGLATVGMTGTYYYHVANFPGLCGPYWVYHNDVTVDFGSHHTINWAIAGWDIGHVIAYYPFQTPGVYHTHVEVDGVCKDNNHPDWGSHAAADGTIFVFTAPVPVKSLACVPATILVGQRSNCTLTLVSRAPGGGTQVKLMTPQPSQLTVPLTTIVPFNRPSTIFRVTGAAKGSADVYATSGEQSDAIVSATITVN